MFESRISELEAQLTQTKMDLRKAQEEAEMYKKRLEEANPTGTSSEFFKQIENLQRYALGINSAVVADSKLT